jgi:hypothetical protein
MLSSECKAMVCPLGVGVEGIMISNVYYTPDIRLSILVSQPVLCGFLHTLGAFADVGRENRWRAPA